jgi:hypothetical protein
VLAEAYVQLRARQPQRFGRVDGRRQLTEAASEALGAPVTTSDAVPAPVPSRMPANIALNGGQARYTATLFLKNSGPPHQFEINAAIETRWNSQQVVTRRGAFSRTDRA